MIKRDIEGSVRDLVKGYPAIALTGPRQSGKTTLARYLFADRPYVSLENPDNRELATTDPRGFLEKYHEGAVLDEIQNCPALFSYLQGVLDASSEMGRFVLTGSQQFGLLAGVTQSLAGRIAMVQLLPFTCGEAYAGKPPALEEVLFRGLYPPVHDRNLDPSVWNANYMQTYIERDVRKMVNVRDLSVFQRFVRLCAGRVGQLLNLSQLAADAGITHNTARAWISILEAAYIVFLLQPHHRNFSKRIIKTPKLYFHDTGLAIWLLGMHKPEQIETCPQRGALFENWVISEMIKHRFNRGVMSNLYFWRDRAGHEVDVIIEEAGNLIPIEVKSGQTVNSDYFKGIDYWLELARPPKPRACLVYAGKENHKRKETEVVSWRNLAGRGPHPLLTG
ncbi:MAG: ATP-binding protein [Deltaproteobacteria bacterium]|nr:ATP-binding protein [Deltaproteobacteria bacterium]